MSEELNRDDASTKAVLIRYLGFLDRMIAFFTENKEHFEAIARRNANGDYEDTSGAITEGNLWEVDELIAYIEENDLEDMDGYDRFLFSADIVKQLIALKKENYEIQRELLAEQYKAGKRILNTMSTWVKNAEAALEKDPENEAHVTLREDFIKVKQGLPEFEQSILAMELKLASMQKEMLN